LIALAALVVLRFASGFYMLSPGHVGVVRTFGKETARTEPGLHYRFPWPFQRTDVVSVDQIRRIEVGFEAEHQQPT
jgi:modulator of FtsH protease HflK